MFLVEAQSRHWNGGTKMDRSILGGTLRSALIALALVAMVGCSGSGGSDSGSVQLGGVPVGTGTAMLSWAPPTTNTDGTPTDLLGFRVYLGSSPQNLQPIRLVSALDTSVVIDSLPAGQHYFAVTAVSLNGAESAFSNIETKTIST